MVKTIVASFDDYRTAQRVARELMNDGFMARDIGIVASGLAGAEHAAGDGITKSAVDHAAATGAVTGGVVGGAAGLAASLMALSIPGIGPVIAAGPLVTALTAASAGAVAGGLIGTLTDAGIPEEHASYFAECLRRGGALVTVKADETRSNRVSEIMRANGAIDLETRVLRWREAGWEGWNEAALPYTREEAERERRVYGTHADPLTGLPSTNDPELDNRRDSTIRH